MDLAPAVELTDEEELRLAVIEDVVDGVGVEGGIERNADVPGHPDRQIPEHEVGAVLGDHGDVAVGREVKRAQVGRHSPGLVHGFGPGVFHRLSVTDGLDHVHAVRGVAFPLIDGVKKKLMGQTPTKISHLPLSSPGTKSGAPDSKAM